MKTTMTESYLTRCDNKHIIQIIQGQEAKAVIPCDKALSKLITSSSVEIHHLMSIQIFLLNMPVTTAI